MKDLAVNPLWWNEPKADAYRHIWAHVQFLQEKQSYQKTADLHFLRLYSNRVAFSLEGHDWFSAIDSGEKIRLNVCKSCLDTSVAQTATQKSRPMHLVTGGDFEAKQRAKRLDKFVLGCFQDVKQYVLGLDIYRDAGIYGSGFEKIYDDHGRIRCEKVPPSEILVDDHEAKYGKPRQLFHVKEVEKAVLKMDPDFKKYKAEIELSCLLHQEASDSDTLTDKCTVIEVWLLPSFPGAGDGLHAISVEKVCLVHEEWKDVNFPIAKYDWTPALYGYRGMGLIEELQPVQIEINYIAQKIQKLMNIMTTSVWVEKGSQVGPINNKDGACRSYTGRPPMFQTVSPISGEYFQHLDRLKAVAYELSGISQLSAQSLKPAGLDSGAAIRAFQDVGSQRFRHMSQRWAQFNLDVGERMVECARRIRDRGEDVQVLCQGDRDVESINFESAELERDKYVMAVHPMNALPDEPAGKIQTLKELAQVNPALGPALMQLLDDVPDLGRLAKRENAQFDLPEKYISSILEHGVYESPFAEMNLQATRTQATSALLQARIDGVPEDRIELLRRFIDEVDFLMTPPAPQMPATPPEGMPPGAGMPPGPSGPPQGIPGEIPASPDMLPIVPPTGA